MATAAALKDEETAHRFAKDHLKAFIERIERLEEEKKSIADDIKDVYAEAKANGFDVKALRTIVKLRKQDIDERKEQEAVLEVYMQALGMLFDTPLGQAATERATSVAAPRRPARRAARGDDFKRRVQDKIMGAFGDPVSLTEDEKQKGYTAAFVKNGDRVAIGVDMKLPRPSAAVPTDEPDIPPELDRRTKRETPHAA